MASSKTVTLAKYGLTAALGAALSMTITTLTATTANVTTLNAGTATVQPASGSGILKVQSATGVSATGSILCLEDRLGVMKACTASGGRLDCDTDSRNFCS